MPSRYSTGAIILHWAIAIAVIVNWRIAENAEHASRAARAEIMADHMATGVLILLLTLARLTWRLTHPQPPFSQSLKRWEATLARTVHFVFYVLLVGLPLIGWIGNSLEDGPIDMFGLFQVPALPLGHDRHLGHEILEVHGTLGTVMIYLIGLHILGALKHHFFDKNGELYRMLPFGRPRG